MKNKNVDGTNCKINKTGTVTVRESAYPTGLRLHYMQFAHNFIRSTCVETTSSYRAMLVEFVTNEIAYV
nr:hypothetical protein [uncultured Rhodoferax sp.]